MTTTANPQRMAALQRANDIRMDRAALRRSIEVMTPADGMRRLAELICDPPACMQNAKVSAVLSWPRRQGPRTVDQQLQRLRIAQRHNARVEELTDRQRRLLAAVLTGDLS